MTSLVLRPNQLAAADAVEDAFRAGINRPLVDSCVGSGKSLIMAEVARRAIQRGERVIIGAHTRELVEQNAIACRALGLTCGINAAALGERTWRAPVISAAIQSVYKSAQSFGPIQLFLGDECFPAGTLVSTPLCDVPIECLQTGDFIDHALGVGRIEAVSKQIVTTLIEVEFDNGDKLQCTGNHPLFTLQGWKRARALETGSVVFRYEGVRELRRDVSADNAETSRWRYQACFTEDVGRDAFLLDILFKEAGKCHARSGSAREDDSHASSHWAQADSARRQRSGDDETTGGVDCDAWSGVGIRVSSSDTASPAVADTLQDRYSQSTFANRNRSGRWLACREAQNPRREKKCASAFARVVRVSRIELTRPCYVYNMQVAGHPSYFANGCLVHNCHLWPHSESGMYRSLVRDLGVQRAAGFSGTVFRLQGGSLVEGEGAPFERVVYRYSILDGIRDGYLVPAFSVSADDKIDPTKLKTRQGEFTGGSQDAQMIALIDNHIAQMVHHGRDRKAWLVFEASTKAARAMVERLKQWGVSAGLVLGETPAGERAAAIQAYRAGRLKCLVNVAALTTGFDVQEVDMLVMRRATKSLGLYIQMTGRLLRTIGGNIAASERAGKADGIVLDFAGVLDFHGPLDFIRPKDTPSRLVSCESCSKRNAAAAMRCWSCDDPMTKLCPACLGTVQKGVLDCDHCGYDMRTGGAGTERKAAALLETPSGAALIASYKTGAERMGGWLPIRRAWEKDGVSSVATDRGDVFVMSVLLAQYAPEARWVRQSEGKVEAVLVPNGAARTSVRQIDAAGKLLIVPMPSVLGEVAA